MDTVAKNCRLLRIFRAGLALIGPILFTGCATNSFTHSITVAVQPASDFPEAMLTKVIYATVMYDEDSVSKLSRVDRNVAYDQGVRYGSDDERMRLVRVDMLNPRYPVLKWMSLAAVPDEIPLLKQGDVVAIRMPTNLDSLLAFSSRKEGTSVVGVACMVERANFQQCWKSVPVENPEQRMRGANGVAPIPFHPTLAAYHYTYTPRYGRDGKVLATAVLLPPRERYSTFLEDR